MCHKILDFIVFYRNLDMRILSERRALLVATEEFCQYLFLWLAKCWRKRISFWMAYKIRQLSLSFWIKRQFCARTMKSFEIQFDKIISSNFFLWVCSSIMSCRLAIWLKLLSSMISSEKKKKISSVLWQEFWEKKLCYVIDGTFDCPHFRISCPTKTSRSRFSAPAVCYRISLCFIHIPVEIRNFLLNAFFSTRWTEKYQ